MATQKFNFENAINELSGIVKKLESGECSLDESISLFEKGIELSKKCNQTLENARQKIITLTEAEEESDNNDW